MLRIAEMQPAPAQVVVIETKLGWLAVAWRDAAVTQLRMGYQDPAAALGDLEAEPIELRTSTPLQRQLIDRLQRYADGEPDAFLDLEIDLSDRTEFQRKVLEACRQIPYGQTQSYAELAAAAGSPRASRAVGNVMARNRTPLIIPCHRVLGKNSLGGFSSPLGLSLKKQLLHLEGAEY